MQRFNDFLGLPIGRNPLDKDLFEDVFGNIKAVPDMLRMKADVVNEDDKYCVIVDLPGFTKEDVEIDVEDGCLTIEAKKVIEETEEKVYLRRERSETSLLRKFRFEKNIVEDDVAAKLENGVLTVTLPKKEVPLVDTKKKITIE